MTEAELRSLASIRSAAQFRLRWMNNDVHRAMAIAYHHAGLFYWPISEVGAVRVSSGYLEVGPFAHPNVIATVTCRHMLARRGVHEQHRVASLVEAYGFGYVDA